MLEKIKTGLRKFMSGRHGADQLNLALLVAGLIVMLVASFTGSMICMLIYLVLYVFCLFRMFSRNNVKRSEENMRYLTLRNKAKSEITQFFSRMKNIRKYKYFRCPQCKTRMRMPRKSGEHTVQCKKCGNQFKMKA